MMVSETLQTLKKAVLDGDDDLALSLAQESLKEGARPLAIVNETIVAGIQEAGELWKQLYEVSFCKLPVNQFPKSVYVCSSHITVINIISMFPYIACE